MAPLMAGQMPVVVVSPLPPWTAVRLYPALRERPKPTARAFSRLRRCRGGVPPGAGFSPNSSVLSPPTSPLTSCHLQPLFIVLSRRCVLDICSQFSGVAAPPWGIGPWRSLCFLGARSSQAPSVAIPIHLFRSLLVAQSRRPGGRGGQMPSSSINELSLYRQSGQVAVRLGAIFPSKIKVVAMNPLREPLSPIQASSDENK